MGETSVDRQHLDRLLADSASTYGAPYQQAFAQLDEAHRGRPIAETLPLLRRAADEALLGFTDAGLRGAVRLPFEQGSAMVLRVRLSEALQRTGTRSDTQAASSTN
ncbi:hypothetical protein Slala03_75570 [Streptomyces lavendulae subsp. lavendulae]|uniref:hypothetical protein n=1 Tax=Streptomyces lavendulae TaxID=1914 RepID=UPI0024A2F668|nr:hypothetical protein [Streptomyces lavendulae]GLV87868.1 hypothetical protein Slala03_75570 [Streptomyces lavendulae subsp. lavendulae]